MKWARSAIVGALCLTTLSACGGASADDAAKGYLAAWAKGDLAAAGRFTDNPEQATRALSDLRATLHVTRVQIHLDGVHAQAGVTNGEAAVMLTLQGAGDWTYTTTFPLRKVSGHWRVHWSTTDINPAFSPGTRLVLRRSLPPRAPLLAGDGQPLFTTQPIVNVGLEPQRMGAHAASTIATVAHVLKVDPTALTAAVRSAKPDAFVPVITLRLAAYEAVKPRIYNLPGTVFHEDAQSLPPATGFARALLGTVGPATADVLKASGGAYVAGDVLGLSGLQEVFQRRLAGTATTSVVVVDATGATVSTLKRFSGGAGRPVQTTLDIKTQEAAEAALAHEAKPAALVAVRSSDGAILAAASTPDATSYDRALSGRYPPGSTFKVITTYALLDAGVTPSTTVACPPSITVDGKTFHNFENESQRSPSFATDFAMSCNTAFVGAAAKLHSASLPTAATAFGVGAPWHLPVDAFSGSVPPPTDAVEQAADAIGQGRVLVSPLTMALVAAAVDSGTPHAPTLVRDPAQPSTAASAPLDPARLSALRTMMRSVVTSGTAATAHLPAATFGKTGTAEFGSANPPKTHAWFLGYRGGIAFAVLVEGGGVGGQVAAPIAAACLRALA
ncbi:MAG TPA: penicillin-binding transpeptidase domain-containing protein [Mycobacteriales bacterium]|nr:penicillin-binding transpeptidase domain-containing protein [Mycobacteriales bacterium]